MDGGYGRWGRWSKCTKACGGGTQKKTRTCNKPVPIGSGKDCDVLGPSQKTRKCNVQSCGGKRNWFLIEEDNLMQNKFHHTINLYDEIFVSFH